MTEDEARTKAEALVEGWDLTDEQCRRVALILTDGDGQASEVA